MVSSPSSPYEALLEGRIVVADTSSLLLAGTKLLETLPACTFVIPSVVVRELEEKRTHATVGFLARDWLRLLEQLRDSFGNEVASGVYPPEHPQVLLRVEPNHSQQDCLPKHLRDGSHDSTILAVAVNLAQEAAEGLEGEAAEVAKRTAVAVLSNDLPMRLHATVELNMTAIEFNQATILNTKPFDGSYSVSLDQEEYAEVMEGDRDLKKLLEDIMGLDDAVASHSLLKVKVEGSDTLLEPWVLDRGKASPLKRRQRASGIEGRTVEQDLALRYLMAPAEKTTVVSLGGGAGTGKTLLTMAAGLELVHSNQYQKLVVFRSLHEMGQGQEMGFLPGTVEEKMEVWAGAIWDALDVIASSGGKKSGAERQEAVKRLKAQVEVSPITYLRGRSLSNSFIVIEEAQNFSRNELLNVLSRAGIGSKIVLTSDPNQVDNRFLQTGSKADIVSVVDSLKQEEIFAHITLAKTERSRIAEITSRLLEE